MPETAPPAAGAGLPAPAATQQPPMGVSPATGPTPNKGYEAAAQQRAALLLKQATDILPMAGATSDLGKTLLKVIDMLAKHVPPGSSSQASERNAIDDLQRKNMQQQQTNQSIRGMGGAPPAQGMPQPGMAA